MKLQQYADATPFLFRARDINTVENLDDENDILELFQLAKQSPSLMKKLRELANIWHYIGLCYIKQYHFKEAMEHLLLAFNFHKLSKTDDLDTVHADLLTCYMAKYLFERLENCLQSYALRLSSFHLENRTARVLIIHKTYYKQLIFD